VGRVKLEAGERVSLIDSSKPISNNCWLVDDDDALCNSDLHQTQDWAETCKGVELTPEGKAFIDFYVYSVGEYSELITNIGVCYEHGAIQYIENVGCSKIYVKQLK
jgi:hypothetical protein